MEIRQGKQKRGGFKAERRRWEFNLINSALKEAIPNEQLGKLRLLEFGCGPSDGARYLYQLGDLVVTDIYQDPLLNLPVGVEFEIADIHYSKESDS